MATKTIVIGEVEEKKQNFIIFVHQINIGFGNNWLSIPKNLPKDYKYIELIKRRKNITYFDLMFAYDDPNKRENGILYLGHWGNGIVKL